jgi:transcriptional regulator with PAS, ATPase and Fis domain
MNEYVEIKNRLRIMRKNAWVDDFPGAATVCDDQGRIIEMNAKAVEDFAADGGEKLIGRNVLDCHPEPARTKLKDLMDNRKTNIYTVEKGGVRKLIYQVPWYQDGQFAGLVELSLEIPRDLPHRKRD